MYRLALVALFSIATTAAAEEELAGIGRAAPSFRLPLYGGKPGESFGLDRWVGQDPSEKGVKTVVVSFMASFCEPCKKEMPYLQLLHEKYKDQGLRVMMVSIDTEVEGQKKVEDLIALNKVTFPVLKDRFNLVARRWLGSKVPLPSLFFISPNGAISQAHRGYNEDMSNTLLAEVQSNLGVPKEDVRLAAPEPVKAEPVPVAEETEPKKGKKGKKTGKEASKTATAPIP